MRLLLLLHILLAILVLVASAAENSTKPTKKTLRMVKRLKKISKLGKKSSKAQDQAKSASYHVPIVVSSEDVSHVPVKLELHEDDRYIKSAADLHPIEPIHLVNVDGTYHHQQTHPVYIESKDPIYSAYPADGSHSDPVYHGPVAVPSDYPPRHDDDSSYSHNSGISPHNYYPENYGDLSAIPGSPGIDYPTYSYTPKTGFECLQHTSTPGFYADVETKCQMWHYCQPDGRHDRFLCPNGTVFDQLTRVCNWWFNVHCDNSLNLYDINFDLYREPLKIPSQSLDNSIDAYLSSPPSQTHDTTAYHSSPSSHPTSVDKAPGPNSFLRHVKDFEASLGSQSHTRGNYKSHPEKDSYKTYPEKESYRTYPEKDSYRTYPPEKDSYRTYPEKDNYAKPIHSVASPRPIGRYPSKIAPVPRVVHEYDRAPIDYDSSNAHTLSTPSDDFRLPYSGSKSKQKKKVARRKLRRHPKIYTKNSDDDIPTYREGKATPPSATRRYRVVRRRKVNKD